MRLRVTVGLSGGSLGCRDWLVGQLQRKQTLGGSVVGGQPCLSVAVGNAMFGGAPLLKIGGVLTLGVQLTCHK